ncbi:uncharacterized protein TrAtP1_003171 [Trichoderma atroviride]|uniref:uncharacterized protein n=1 Tax=Hypocrea atroviridis TaxID=63577 RepID=UPI00332605B3|nr:hypothetical protein TrAtP1_003171 [Trichoderma atroviride]
MDRSLAWSILRPFFSQFTLVQSPEAVCFFGTTWSVLYVLCNSTSVCFYTEWSICPEEEDVTCRGSLFAHVFFGALPAVCSDRNFSRPLWISMSDDGHISLRWTLRSTIPFFHRLAAQNWRR